MGNGLFCTCQSGEHRGILLAEAKKREPLEAFAAKIDLGETIVHAGNHMRFPA